MNVQGQSARCLIRMLTPRDYSIYFSYTQQIQKLMWFPESNIRILITVRRLRYN